MHRFAFVAVLLSAGCASSSSYLDWQIQYARSIPDPQGQAAAMAAVARSAAYGGDLSVLTAALRELRDDPRHDDVAAECALHLHQSGNTADARRVAKRIADPTRRQETLDKLAEKKESEGQEKDAGEVSAVVGRRSLREERLDRRAVTTPTTPHGGWR